MNDALRPPQQRHGRQIARARVELAALRVEVRAGRQGRLPVLELRRRAQPARRQRDDQHGFSALHAARRAPKLATLRALVVAPSKLVGDKDLRAVIRPTYAYSSTGGFQPSAARRETWRLVVAPPLAASHDIPLR